LVDAQFLLAGANVCDDTGQMIIQFALSHRSAAVALQLHPNTVGPWFKMLEERGFIHMTRAPYLGPSGIGRASTWALAEAPIMNGSRASLAFKKWSPPRMNTVHILSRILCIVLRWAWSCPEYVTLGARSGTIRVTIGRTYLHLVIARGER
jgi:hypothetical protein